MGATRVDVRVSNPAQPERSWEGAFLVDTGASNSFVPRKHLDAIGVTPKGTRNFEMADGSVETFDIAPAHLDFMGVSTTGTVVFGDDDAEPLLGFIALEDAQMEVDPLGERLKPVARPWLLAGLRHFARHRSEP